MRERGIIFSAPMVRAILAGTKMQTRRIVKAKSLPDGDGYTFNGCALVRQDAFGTSIYPVKCPYGEPGDRLWVRETWCEESGGPDYYPSVFFRADNMCREFDGPESHSDTHIGCPGAATKWRPSIFMPRMHSRIALEITGVRVERLQDISAADARAEGITIPESNVVCACEGPATDPGPTHMSHCRWRDPDVNPDELDRSFPRPVVEFAILWNQINGKRAKWSSNPFVWALTVKRVEPKAEA